MVHEKRVLPFCYPLVTFFKNFSMGPVRSVLKVVSPSDFVDSLIRR